MKYLCVVDEAAKKRKWVLENEFDPNTMRVIKVDLRTDDGVDALSILLDIVYHRKKQEKATS